MGQHVKSSWSLTGTQERSFPPPSAHLCLIFLLLNIERSTSHSRCSISRSQALSSCYHLLSVVSHSFRSNIHTCSQLPSCKGGKEGQLFPKTKANCCFYFCNHPTLVMFWFQGCSKILGQKALYISIIMRLKGAVSKTKPFSHKRIEETCCQI